MRGMRDWETGSGMRTHELSKWTCPSEPSSMFVATAIVLFVVWDVVEDMVVVDKERREKPEVNWRIVWSQGGHKGLPAPGFRRQSHGHGRCSSRLGRASIGLKA